MRIPYVAAAEVPASIADELEDVDQSVRDASYRVRTELLTARFEVVNGVPADEEVAQAIKDATIAQLRFWAETGDETGAGAQVGGGSILSVSLPGGGGSLSAAAKEEARTAPAVREILHAVDGITWNVGHY